MTTQTTDPAAIPPAEPKRARGSARSGSLSRSSCWRSSRPTRAWARSLHGSRTRMSPALPGRWSRCSVTTTGWACSRFSRSSRCSLLITIYVLAWRRYGPHPVLLMGIVTTLIVWQDPIMNWSPYAVYNPQLWHWPEDWPLGITLADGGAVPRDRLHHVLPGPVLPGHLDPAQDPGPRARRLVRLASSADQPGADHPAPRDHHRCDARDHAGAHRASTSTHKSFRSDPSSSVSLISSRSSGKP